MAKADSNKTSKVQIIVAVIGSIGVIASALIWNVEKWWPKPNDNRAANASSTNIPIASPTFSSSESSRAAHVSDGCLGKKLSVVPVDRKQEVVLEGNGIDIIGGKQSKEGLAGAWFVANNRPIGAIMFSPVYADSKNYSYRVEHLLNSKCEEIGYVNVKDPDHNPVLRNWDPIRMTLDGQEYWFRLGYNTDTHAISAKFLDKEIQ